MNKRHSGPQILAKLRQADVLIDQGKIVPEVCRDIGVGEQTYYCRPQEGGKGTISKNSPSLPPHSLLKPPTRQAQLGHALAGIGRFQLMLSLYRAGICVVCIIVSFQPSSYRAPTLDCEDLHRMDLGTLTRLNAAAMPGILVAA